MNRWLKITLIVGLVLLPVRLFASSGHNVVVELPLPNYASLAGYAKEVDGVSNFHMTLTFTQMVDPFAQAETAKLQQEIRQSSTIQALASEIELEFVRFGQLGSALVAFYRPVDAQTKSATSKAQRDWEAIVNEVRRLVRRASNRYAGKATVNRQKIQGKSGPVEWATLNQKPLYLMDLRPVIPHVTVRYQSSSNDLQKLKAAMSTQGAVQIKDLQIRPNTLSVNMTKLIDLKRP